MSDTDTILDRVTPESVLAAIEARAASKYAPWDVPGFVTQLYADRDWLLAALHAEQEARARVEAALTALRNTQRTQPWSKFWEGWDAALAAVDAALAPDASEGEPK